MRQAGPRLRVGIDTGGTFTDVVAYDEVIGRACGHQDADDARRPLGRVHRRAGQGAGSAGRRTPSAVAAVSHGTTIATNQLLEGKVGTLGFITTEGFEFILEIARQSVPDGYGNSYFWVKPDRIVPADLVKTVGGRLDHTGAELRPFDEDGAVAVARWFRDRGIDTLGVCFLHSYANPEHERRMAAVLAREHPAAVVSLSCEVLREYREYERSVTTLLDAAVKPRVASYLGSIGERLAAPRRPAAAAARDEVQRRRAERRRGDQAPPITTVLSGPAAGALGAALIAEAGRRHRVLTCDGGGTSTDVAVVTDGEPALTTEGRVGEYPSMIPMVDVVTVGAGGGSIAWISPEGALKVGPRSAGADPGPICYGQGGTEVTVTDAHLVLGRIPPHLLGGEVPLDQAAAQGRTGRPGRPARAQRAGVRHRHPRGLGLEPGQRGPPDHRQARPGRAGLHARDVRRVGIAAALPADRHPRRPRGARAAEPRQRVGVRAADRGRAGSTRCAPPCAGTTRWTAPRVACDLRRRWRTEASARAGEPGIRSRAQQRLVRTADLRYYGQAFEVRVPVPGPAVRPPFDAAGRRVASAFHDAHRALYGYDFRGDARQHVEWVNLRVTGVGPITQARACPNWRAGDGDPARARTGSRPVCFGRGEDFVDGRDLRQARPGRR